MLNDSAKLKPVRPYQSPIGRNCSDRQKSPAEQRWLKESSNYEKLYLEIGCGAGLHPVLWTQNHPTHALLAVERTKQKFKAFQQRKTNHNLPNLFAVHGEAERLLPGLIQPHSLHGLFLLYPNPYPKESQANKRWHRNPFLQFLLQCLQPGGEVVLATNEKFYFDEFKLYMNDFWQLKQSKENKFQTIERPRTHFEKKYLARGETCFEVCFTTL